MRRASPSAETQENSRLSGLRRRQASTKPRERREPRRASQPEIEARLKRGWGAVLVAVLVFAAGVEISQNYALFCPAEAGEGEEGLPVRSLRGGAGVVGDVHAEDVEVVGGEVGGEPAALGILRGCCGGGRDGEAGGDEDAVAGGVAGLLVGVGDELMGEAVVGEDGADLAAAGDAELGEDDEVRGVAEEGEDDLGEPSGAAAVEDVPGEDAHEVTEWGSHGAGEGTVSPPTLWAMPVPVVAICRALPGVTEIPGAEVRMGVNGRFRGRSS